MCGLRSRSPLVLVIKPTWMRSPWMTGLVCPWLVVRCGSSGRLKMKVPLPALIVGSLMASPRCLKEFITQRRAARAVTCPRKSVIIVAAQKKGGKMFNRYLFTALAAATVTLVDGAIAQDFPTRPIRIVTGLPGGGSDLTARMIA